MGYEISCKFHGLWFMGIESWLLSYLLYCPTVLLQVLKLIANHYVTSTLFIAPGLTQYSRGKHRDCMLVHYLTVDWPTLSCRDVGRRRLIPPTSGASASAGHQLFPNTVVSSASWWLLGESPILPGRLMHHSCQWGFEMQDRVQLKVGQCVCVLVLMGVASPRCWSDWKRTNRMPVGCFGHSVSEAGRRWRREPFWVHLCAICIRKNVLH